MEVLGIKVDNLTLEHARLKVRDFLDLPGQFKIFTPNPEMIVKARKDERFKETLNSGDLNICDGFGLWCALKLSSRHRTVIQSEAKNLHQSRSFHTSRRVRMTTSRITGVDFMLEICQIAEETRSGIYLIGSEKDEIVKKTADELQKKFPKLNIVGYDNGPIISDYHSGRLSSNRFYSHEAEDGSLEVIDKIRRSGASIIFVAFGMGKQEQWITDNLTKLPTVKVAMGVGGAFDYISGFVPRSPLFLRKIGLEWLYRLVHQPSRFGRVFNATIKFFTLYLSNFRKK